MCLYLHIFHHYIKLLWMGLWREYSSLFNFKTVSKSNITKNLVFLKIHGVLTAKDFKDYNPHFSQSSFHSTVLFPFYIKKLDCKRKVGDLNHLLMQNSKNFYFRVAHFLIRYCSVLQFSWSKIPTISSEVPAAHIPAGGNFKGKPIVSKPKFQSFSTTWEGTGLLWSAVLH